MRTVVDQKGQGTAYVKQFKGALVNIFMVSTRAVATVVDSP